MKTNDLIIICPDDDCTPTSQLIPPFLMFRLFYNILLFCIKVKFYLSSLFSLIPNKTKFHKKYTHGDPGVLCPGIQILTGLKIFLHCLSHQVLLSIEKENYGKKVWQAKKDFCLSTCWILIQDGYKEVEEWWK